MSKTTFKGIIYDSKTIEAIPYALIKTEKTTSTKKEIGPSEYSDKDGKFSIELEDGTAWNVFIHAPLYTTKKEIFEKGKPYNDKILLNQLSDKKDKRWGIGFFISNIVAVLILIFLYILFHTTCDKAIQPLSNILLKKVDQLHEEKVSIQEEFDGLQRQKDSFNYDANTLIIVDTLWAKLISGQTTSIDSILKLTIPKDEKGKKFTSQLTKFKNDIGILKSSSKKLTQDLDSILMDTDKLTVTDKEAVKRDMKKVDASIPILNGNMDKVGAQFTALEDVLRKPPINGFIEWNHYPWSMLEILFWALAGIFAKKILEVGSYLRWKRFYRVGIFMHISQFVAVPLLVLVGMLLLSLVKFQVSMPNSPQPFTIDLSNQLILGTVSFILAFNPWGISNFIERASETIINKVQKSN